MALFPYADIIVDSLTVTDAVSVVSSDTRSKQFLNRRTIGQRYELEMSCRVTPDKFLAANAYFTSLRGGTVVTEITLPFYGQNTVANKTTSGELAIGVRAATLASVTGILPGMYFKFANHNKVYCCISVAGTVINFEPNLIRTVPNNTTVQFNNVPITCKMTTPSIGFGSTGNKLPVTRNVKFVEVIG